MIQYSSGQNSHQWVKCQYYREKLYEMYMEQEKEKKITKYMREEQPRGDALSCPSLRRA